MLGPRIRHHNPIVHARIVPATHQLCPVPPDARRRKACQRVRDAQLRRLKVCCFDARNPAKFGLAVVVLMTVNIKSRQKALPESA